MRPDKLRLVHGTYDAEDADNVDDVAGCNKAKSIVILSDIKGDYIKCLITLFAHPSQPSRGMRHAAVISPSSFPHSLQICASGGRSYVRANSRLLVIKSSRGVTCNATKGTGVVPLG